MTKVIRGKYEPRVICDCGWSKYAPFGSPSHAAANSHICPECGTKVEAMPVKYVRPVYAGPRFWFKRFAGWEEKGKVLHIEGVDNGRT